MIDIRVIRNSSIAHKRLTGYLYISKLLIVKWEE